MANIGVVPLHLLLCFAAICLTQYCCDATRTIEQRRKQLHLMKSKSKSSIKLSSNSDPYVSSPFSLPPYESLPPFPSPDQTTPPYCVYPSPAASTVPLPLPPPAAGVGLLPPTPLLPTPPAAPYYNYEPPPPLPLPPSPYYYSFPPSGSGSVPPPPSRFLPPIVYPPPAVPPPPRRTPLTAMWCVAKAAVPDPIIQEAMDYACGSGADCDQIQPAGSCFMPNTLFAHASYAFNSYWQRSKAAGGRCDFGGTAILVTVDPSYDGCHFVYL